MPLRVSLTERVAIEARGMVVDEQRFPGPQGRLVFAYLLAEHGRPVPRDALAEMLWGDTPPATWEKALSVLVSKLRALLNECGLDGSACLTSAFGCYQLTLPDGTWIDVVAARDAVAAAERALAAGELEQARSDAAIAESIARRTFLPGEASQWVEDTRADLRETLIRALDCLAEAQRLAGDSRGSVRAAAELVRLEPYRERGYRLLMQAQSAAGNDAEALRVYERCRRLLSEELGTYPSSETEAIYRELLEHPSGTTVVPGGGEAPEVESAPPNERRSRRRLAIAATIALVVAAAALALVQTRDSGGVPPAPNSVVALDPSGNVATTLRVGARPVSITSGAGALWVTNLDDRTVTRIDVASREVVRTIPIGDTPTGITATPTGVWVTDGAGEVARIDPRYDRPVYDRPLRESIGFFGETARAALAAFGFLWVASPDGVVLKVDPVSARVVDTVGVGNVPSAMAAGAGSVWVTNTYDGTATRIDPETLATRTFPVGNGPVAVAINAAGAWVTNSGDNAVARIDVATNAVADTTPVGDGPAAILATPAALWVANGRDGTVMRLHPRTGKVTRTVPLGGTPTALAAADRHVWVTVAPSPPQTPPADGARLTTRDDDFRSLDPAFGLWLLRWTCAHLVTYPDAPGAEGLRIVPEVAEAAPRPTDEGTTYTFRVRRGFRFSPPSNEPVTALTFKETIERVANPRLGSPFASSFSGIVGYDAYVSGNAREITGIAARGETLRIRLSEPDGGFLATLANGVACAVPRGTPAVPGLNNIPSAGPYYVARYTPRQQLVLRRNPNYRGNRSRRLEQLVIAIGIDPARAVAQVMDGAADYALQLPRDAGPRLAAAYGRGSDAAEAGHQQYFVNEANGARVLHMNASRPLFADARLRRAVSFAIDRPALVAQGRRFAEVNPFNAGTATDDYLPPFAPGVVDVDLYPVDGPDLRRARQLAGPVRATATMYTPNVSPWREEAQIVRRNLKPLGIDVQVKEFALGDYFTRVSRPREPFDLAISGYLYGPDPVRNLAFLVGPTGISHFHDAALERRLAAVAKLSGTPRHRAFARVLLEVQRDLVPAAAISTTAARDFFSARIGCQVYHPIWGMDLGALCLRR